MIPIIDQWISEFTESKKVYSTVVFNEYTTGRTVDIVNSVLDNFQHKKQIKSVVSNLLDTFSGVADFSLSPIEMQLAFDDSKWGLFLRLSLKKEVLEKVKVANEWDEIKKINGLEGVSILDEFVSSKTNIQLNADLSIMAISFVRIPNSKSVIKYEKVNDEIPTIVDSAISVPFPKFQIPKLPPVESPFLGIKVKQALEAEEPFGSKINPDKNENVNELKLSMSGASSIQKDIIHVTGSSDAGSAKSGEEVRIRGSQVDKDVDDFVLVKQNSKTDDDSSDSIIKIISSTEEMKEESETIFSSRSELTQSQKETVKIKVVDNPEVSKELERVKKELDFIIEKNKKLEAILAKKNTGNSDIEYFKEKNRELETKIAQIEEEKREWERKIRAREIEVEKKESRARQIIEEYEAQKKEPVSEQGLKIDLAAHSSKLETQSSNLVPDSLTAIANNEKIKSTVDDLKSQVSSEKAKQALDALYAELQTQKSQLIEAARNMSAEQKKLEFQMNSKIQLATQEAAQAKLQADQKQAQLDRMKELMTNLQSRFEKQGSELTKLTTEITQLRTASEAYKRQLEEAQKELEKMKKQKTDTDQKSSAMNPMVKGLQDQLKNIEKQLLTKKQEVEQLKRQLQEKTVAEIELKKQLAKLGGSQPAAAPSAKKAG